MNINGVAKGKEGDFSLAVTLGPFKLIICKNTVVNAFGRGALFIGFQPFIGISWHWSQQAQVGSKPEINGFAVESFIAIIAKKDNISLCRQPLDNGILCGIWLYQNPN